MSEHCDPTQSRREELVGLPRAAMTLLAARGPAIAERLTRAVRPYQLSVAFDADAVRLNGDLTAVCLATAIFNALADTRLDEAAVESAVTNTIEHALQRDLAFRLEGLTKPLRPMSLSQVAFLNTLLHAETPLVFGIGATGTGKTHLAVAAALNFLARGLVKSVVLTRPHVMMDGEVMTAAAREETADDAQLTPLTDILHDLISHSQALTLIEQEKIKILPHGRLRGRTFNDSYIVIDEAQNMTVAKMRMAATRFGRNSRMTITGDPEQVDLRGDEPSGLAHFLSLTEGRDIACVHHFDRTEIIRDNVVAQIEALFAGDADAGLRSVA